MIRPPLTPIPVAGPFNRVGADVLHFPKSVRGNQYAVVFLDSLTKWPEAFATQDQSALTIAKLFVENCVYALASQENLKESYVKARCEFFTT